MRKILCILAVLFTLGQTAFAQDSKQPQSYSFTLQQAIDFAMQNQNNIKNAALDEEIAHYKVNEYIGSGLPQIKGSVDAKRFIDIPTSVVDASAFGGPVGSVVAAQFGLEYAASAGADASQLIFDGTFFGGLQAVKVYEELAFKTMKQTQIETASQVSKAYYTALVNQEYLDLLNANVARLKKLNDDTKAMLDNGFVEQIDFNRVEVTYNNTLVEKDKTEKLYALSYNLLKFQMGMEQNAELKLTDDLANITFDEALPESDAVDFTKRIEFSILQTQHHLQEIDLKVKRFAYLPNLVAYGSLSANAYRFQLDFTDQTKKWYPTTLVGATLNVPIFDGNMKHARIEQSKLALKKIDNAVEMLQQSIALEVVNAKTQLQNNTASLETQRKNRELAKEVSRVTKIKYDQGIGSNLEVVTAETSLKEAEVNYYSALYNALVAKIDYAKATGTLIKQ